MEIKRFDDPNIFDREAVARYLFFSGVFDDMTGREFREMFPRNRRPENTNANPAARYGLDTERV